MKRGGEVHHRPLRVKTRDTRCRSVIDVFVSSRVDLSFRRLALVALRGLANDQGEHAGDHEKQDGEHHDVEAGCQRLGVPQSQTITQKGKVWSNRGVEQDGERHEGDADPDDHGDQLADLELLLRILVLSARCAVHLERLDEGEHDDTCEHDRCSPPHGEVLVQRV
ncbi:MAG: hypothetical protein JWO99_403 [Candidatus Saccharibacteria bacterium]|nr:hypothetical protein [Candidatus Saccharibacteria bacterium]